MLKISILKKLCIKHEGGGLSRGEKESKSKVGIEKSDMLSIEHTENQMRTNNAL